MKMLHPVVAPVAGLLRELRVAVKEQVQARTVLAVIDEGPAA
jgi:biotin carboxyl carrier protein